MLRLSEIKTELNIINDQYGNPTYAHDLAMKLQDICKNLWKWEGKILHLSDQTPEWWVTRCNFAEEIFVQSEKNVICNPIPSSQYPTKAKRPTYSKLLNSYHEMSLPDWKDGLKRYLRSIS
jgi:dTDP-4-dehydrorhamnose reductase